jgi:hypothetical protein
MLLCSDVGLERGLEKEILFCEKKADATFTLIYCQGLIDGWMGPTRTALSLHDEP